MIPSGIGGAYHSLTFGNNVDVNSASDPSGPAGATKARWGPTISSVGTPPGASIGTDPAALAAIGFDRGCWSTGVLDALSESYGYNFLFQNTDAYASAQIDEQPTTLYVEFEIYVDWNTAAPVVNEQWWFLAFTDTDGRLARFINYNSGGMKTAFHNSTPSFGIVSAPKITDAAFGQQQWLTVRLAYTASSNPGTATDGALQICKSNGSFGNAGVLAFTDAYAVAGTPAHFGGALRQITITALNANAYNTTNNTYVRNVYISTTLPAMGMTGTGANGESWFHAYACGRPQISQQDEGTTAGTIKARVWSMYDRNQFARETVGVGMTAQWKYTTDPDNWSTIRDSSSTFAVTVTANAVDQYVGAVTLDNLPENTTIDVRIKWTIDGAFDFFSAKSTFRTASRSTPATIRIVSGSCASMIASISPISTYDVIANESPTFVVVVGDFEYFDNGNTMNYTTAAGYVATAGTAAARQALVKQYTERAVVNNSQWDKIACLSSCIPVGDDHDWGLNAFAGLATAPTDFTAGDGLTLRTEIEAIRRQYFGTRTFNYNPGEAASTVHYHRQRTCKIDILTFDCRRHNDRSTSPIGATQLAWARAIIQATTKPILILIGGVPWHSLDGAGGGADAQENWALNSFADRNLLLADAEANTAIRQVVLISADRHYASINKSEFAAYPKVKLGDLCVSPLNQLARDYTEDTSVAVFQSQFGKTTAQCARAYLIVEINESLLTVAVAVKGLQGTTTQSTANALYTASTGYGTARAVRAPRARRV